MSNKPLLWSYLFLVLAVGHILLVYEKRQIEFYKSATLKYCFRKFWFSGEKSLILTIGRITSYRLLQLRTRGS